MRLSSLLSLVVVTACFALGGCAADAEQASSDATGQSEAALVLVQSRQTLDDGTVRTAALAAEAAHKRVFDIDKGDAVGVGRAAMLLDRGANGEFNEAVDAYEGASSRRPTAGNAPMFDDIALHPLERADVNAPIGAHLPSSQQLSRVNEAHQDTNTSGAKRVP